MAKKVVILSTSLRGGSNSDILARECERGAKEALILMKDGTALAVSRL